MIVVQDLYQKDRLLYLELPEMFIQTVLYLLVIVVRLQINFYQRWAKFIQIIHLQMAEKLLRTILLLLAFAVLVDCQRVHQLAELTVSQIDHLHLKKAWHQTTLQLLAIIGFKDSAQTNLQLKLVITAAEWAIDRTNLLNSKVFNLYCFQTSHLLLQVADQTKSLC